MLDDFFGGETAALHFVYYKLRPPMKQLPNDQATSSQYLFALQSPLHDGRLSVIVDFTPVIALNGKKLQKFSIIPQFNHDFKHYTNGFCTAYEGVYARKQFARYKEKLRAAVNSISAGSIVAKPRQKSRRKCWVCFDHFEDYLQHTQSSQHVTKLRHNFYNKLIRKIANNWMGVNRPRVATRSMRRTGRD